MFIPLWLGCVALLAMGGDVADEVSSFFGSLMPSDVDKHVASLESHCTLHPDGLHNVCLGWGFGLFSFSIFPSPESKIN